MDQIESCISFLAAKASQQISRRARKLLAPYGVTPGQYAVLNVLYEDGKVSGAELGSRLALDSASITGVVDRLEAIGLLERGPDDIDRRVHRLAVTKKALLLRADLDTAMDQLNAEAVQVVGASYKHIVSGLKAFGNAKNWMEHE